MHCLEFIFVNYLCYIVTLDEYLFGLNLFICLIFKFVNIFRRTQRRDMTIIWFCFDRNSEYYFLMIIFSYKSNHERGIRETYC